MPERRARVGRVLSWVFATVAVAMWVTFVVALLEPLSGRPVPPQGIMVGMWAMFVTFCAWLMRQ